MISTQEIEEEAYCGFVCSAFLERHHELIEEVKDFSKHNKEFALVMLGKMIEEAFNTRMELGK